MRLVVGIGNPGARYEGTRHNAGFQVLDLLVRRRDTAFRKESDLAMTAEFGEEGRLMKPLTFVNRTGWAVARQQELEDLAPENILIVVDDVHLPLGRVRLRATGSSGGHNGLNDIERSLGTQAFPRLRIGVVGEGGVGDDLADYVLSRFEPEEAELLNTVSKSAAQAVIGFLEGIPFEELMEKYNRGT